MKNFWISIIKPSGVRATLLLILSIATIVTLNAAGYFSVLQSHLDTERLTFQAGKYSFSLYDILKSIIACILIFWTTAIICDLTEKWLNRLKKIRASNRALVIKIIHIFIYILAFMTIFGVLGIDLTTLTVFSGALGIGLGFGLQKIASNFMSGLILLFEKSVEVDDLIELSDGTFGYIRESRARYTLIETFNGREVLVPNEDLIISRVTNWTYSNKRSRVEINVGVAYDSDLRLVQSLILKAATEHPRCLLEPKPSCTLQTFGDSAVEFSLHFWVGDVTEGRREPHSDVMFSIWEKLKAHSIEIPFPQRDLHIKSSNLNPLESPKKTNATKKTKAKK